MSNRIDVVKNWNKNLIALRQKDAALITELKWHLMQRDNTIDHLIKQLHESD